MTPTDELTRDLTHALSHLAAIYERQDVGFAFLTEITRRAYADFDPYTEQGQADLRTVRGELVALERLGWVRLSDWRGSISDPTYALTPRGRLIHQVHTTGREEVTA